MLAQVVLIVVSVAALSLALVSELAGWILGVEIPLLAEALGLTPGGLEAVLYLVAATLSVLGIVLLRLFPRTLAPIGAVAPDEKHHADAHHPDLERVPHVNDPLQSVYVAVILISGVLLVGAVS